MNPENIGSEDETKKAHRRIKERLSESLRSSFRPEFLNRIDDVVIFKPLGKPEIEKIVDIQFAELSKLIVESGISLELKKNAKSYLVNHGYNLEMGARPLKRLLQKEVENKLAELIIDSEVEDGDTVVVDANKDGLTYNVKRDEKVKSKVAQAA